MIPWVWLKTAPCTRSLVPKTVYGSASATSPGACTQSSARPDRGRGGQCIVVDVDVASPHAASPSMTIVSSEDIVTVRTRYRHLLTIPLLALCPPTSCIRCDQASVERAYNKRS